MKIKTNRSDYSVENFLRILKPILEAKELIGKPIKMTDLSRICISRQASLPMRGYGARELTRILLKASMGNGCFILEGLIVDVFKETDDRSNRDVFYVTFDREISKEQQYLDELAARGEKPKSLANHEVKEVA